VTFVGTFHRRRRCPDSGNRRNYRLPGETTDRLRAVATQGLAIELVSSIGGHPIGRDDRAGVANVMMEARLGDHGMR